VARRHAEVCESLRNAVAESCRPTDATLWVAARRIKFALAAESAGANACSKVTVDPPRQHRLRSGRSAATRRFQRKQWPTCWLAECSNHRANSSGMARSQEDKRSWVGGRHGQAYRGRLRFGDHARQIFEPLASQGDEEPLYSKRARATPSCSAMARANARASSTWGEGKPASALTHDPEGI